MATHERSGHIIAPINHPMPPCGKEHNMANAISKNTTTPKRMIVVLQRGWVVVGSPAKAPAGEIRLENASVIRRWGTQTGLGQLATLGKQPNTVLDACGEVRAFQPGIVLQIPVAEGVDL